MVEAANPHPRPRQIVAFGFQLESHEQIAVMKFGSDHALPCILNETDHVSLWVSASGVGRTLCDAGKGHKQKIRAFLRDSYDHKHLSKWLEFDPARESAKQK